MSVFRTFAYVLVFGVVFASVRWLTPLEPFARLTVDSHPMFLLFSPDGRLAITAGEESTSGKAGPLRMWDVAQGRLRFSVATDWQAIETVEFSPDSQLLAAHEKEGDLKLWSTQTGEEIGSFRPPTKFSNWVGFRFSPDGRFLVFRDYSKGWPDRDYLTFWNIAQGEVVGSIEGNLAHLRFSPDGQSAATFTRLGSQGNFKVDRILLWKVDQRGVPVLDKEYSVTAVDAAIAPDLRTFATAGDSSTSEGAVILRDMATGAKVWSLELDEPNAHVREISFVGRGRFLSGQGGQDTAQGWRWQMRLWDVTSVPKQVGSCAHAPVISPDGAWLATPLDNGAKLLRATAPDHGQDLVKEHDVVDGFYSSWGNAALQGAKEYPTIDFSPDSRLVIVGRLSRPQQQQFLQGWLPPRYNPFPVEPRGEFIRIWDVATAREVMSVAGCHKAVFSPDGKYMATFHQSRTIQLWRLPLRRPLLSMLGWTIPCWGVAALALQWIMKKLSGTDDSGVVYRRVG